jgi:glucokinase
MTALVIDVGGTHTRLALARTNGERAQLDDVEVVDTPSGHLHEVIAAFLANHPKLELSGIAVAAAGRVRRLPGRTAVSLTNTALSIEREDLQAVLSHERVWLMNDLAAVAAALPWLLPAELEAVGSERSSVPGHRIVVGLGTGFGAAALTAKGTVLETEAGHMSLAAVSASAARWTCWRPWDAVRWNRCSLAQACCACTKWSPDSLAWSMRSCCGSGRRVSRLRCAP